MYRLLVLTLLLTISSQLWSQVLRYSAELVLEGERPGEHNTLVTEEIVFLSAPGTDSLRATVRSANEWINIDIPIADIQRIMLQNAVESGSSREHGAGYKFDGIITLKNGNSLEYKRINELWLGLNATVPSPVDGSPVKKLLKPNRLRIINFYPNHGKFMVDKDGNVFPANYRFNPYTGEKLQFGEVP